MPMYIGYYLGYGHSNEYLIHGKYKIVEGKNGMNLRYQIK